jgi:Domain of unknown function in PX-proteins (DUF3818)
MSEMEESEFTPTPDHLMELKLYLESPREYQESLRTRSCMSHLQECPMLTRIATESKSIITIICDEARLPRLEGIQHDIALDYLALAASVRDREHLSNVVCKSHPDLITQSIRDVVTAFEPIIRQMHRAVDLSTTCQHVEDFLTDFLALFHPEEAPEDEQHEIDSAKPAAVTVDQIADVLRKHQGSLHLFLHQMAKGGGEATEEYRAYVKNAVAQFRPRDDRTPRPDETAAILDPLVAALSDADRAKAIELVDDYAAYLAALGCVSDDRLRAAVGGGGPGSSAGAGGPGAFLARWQRILDASPSTPLLPEGPVVYGSSRRSGQAAPAAGEADSWRWPDAPDVGFVAGLLGESFGKALAERGVALRKAPPVE